jgi:hypothetical protein
MGGGGPTRRGWNCISVPVQAEFYSMGEIQYSFGRTVGLYFCGAATQSAGPIYDETGGHTTVAAYAELTLCLPYILSVNPNFINLELDLQIEDYKDRNAGQGSRFPWKLRLYIAESP